MGRFTHEEKCREAMREVGKRRGVYPKLIAKGDLDETKAARLIALMDEIAADYERAWQRKAGSGTDKIAIAVRTIKMMAAAGDLETVRNVAAGGLRDIAS